MTSKALPALTALLVVFLDRLTKVFIVNRFQEAEGFSVIPGIFDITRVNNTGAAFGIFRNSQPVLAAVSLFFIFLITAWLVTHRRQNTSLAFYAWAVVLGGASSNLFDRVRYGYVVDFLDFKVWPVFNVADTAICAGVFIVFLCALADGKGKGV